MALSNAEKQKRYRERKRREAASGDSEAAPVKRTFAEFIKADPLREEAVDTAFHLLDFSRVGNWWEVIEGVNAVSILSDFVGDDNQGALMGLWTLAALLNDYRKEQIDAQLLELQEAPQDNETVKLAAERFAEKLRSTRKELGRANRYEFPPLWVAGE